MDDNIVERSIYRFLQLLLIVDVMLIALHVGQLVLPNFMSWTVDQYFTVNNNHSLGEAFRHIKFVWIVALLVFLMFRRVAPTFFVWALLFIGIGLHDVFEWHGAIGHKLLALIEANGWPVPPGAESGEVIFALAVGTVVLLLIGIAYINADGDTRRMSRRFVLLCLFYAFFAVGIDYLFSLMPAGALATSLGVIEEAGQLIVLTFVLFFLFRHEVWHRSITA